MTRSLHAAYNLQSNLVALLQGSLQAVNNDTTKTSSY